MARKDLTIAKIKWNIADVAKVFGIVLVVPFVCFMVVIVLARLGVLPSAFRQAIRSSSELATMIYTILTLIAEVGAVVWLVKKYSLKFGELGFRKFSILRAIGYIVVVFFVFTVVLSLTLWAITLLLPSIDLSQTQQNGFEFGRSGLGLWLSFLLTVVLTPIIEEVFFRGLMMPALTKKWGWLVGVFATSAIFAVLHVQVNVIVYTFILGLVLSVMYIRLKSIVPGIVLHSLNNALAFAVLAGLIK